MGFAWAGDVLGAGVRERPAEKLWMMNHAEDVTQVVMTLIDRCLLY
jgi:hypothetical protein